MVREGEGLKEETDSTLPRSTVGDSNNVLNVSIRFCSIISWFRKYILN